MNDALGVLFCLLGVTALVGAWRVFMDRARPPVENFPSNDEPREGHRGLVGFLMDLIFNQLFSRRPDGPFDWVSVFLALSAIGTIFLAGGVYVGLR
jgi:hypothetical protein